MNIHEITYTLDKVDEAARELRRLMPLAAVFTFVGPLGVGKTTLIGTLLRECGIDADIQSPTFTYLNTYVNAKGETFYHFDLYRLKSRADFTAAGFDEYLYEPASWALIEWPEIIMPLLKKRVINCVLEYAGEDRRKLRYSIVK